MGCYFEHSSRSVKVFVEVTFVHQIRRQTNENVESLFANTASRSFGIVPRCGVLHIRSRMIIVGMCRGVPRRRWIPILGSQLLDKSMARLHQNENKEISSILVSKVEFARLLGHVRSNEDRGSIQMQYVR